MCNRVAIIKEGKLIAVEKISTLEGNTYKKFKLEIKLVLSGDYFNINGVSNLELKDNVISFLFKGNLNLIMKRISESTKDKVKGVFKAMNIFIREMKAHRKSLIFWSIGMLLMIIS